MKRDLIREDDGFSTVGMVVALLVTLSLLFSAARVYRVSSASADIQNVADAGGACGRKTKWPNSWWRCALCDAVVLSLSLTGLGGIRPGGRCPCVCRPRRAWGEKLIEMGGKVMDARDAFADKAAAGLNQLQKALPFLAAANAASVAANNASPMEAEYLALAVLVPSEGAEIGVDAADAAKGVDAAVRENSEELQRAAREAEEAAQEANEAKARAFMRDCGDNPAYCMYERARALSLLPDAENPLYHSVDAWSFSVPPCPRPGLLPRQTGRRGARRHVGGGAGALGAARAVLPLCGKRSGQGLRARDGRPRFPPTSRFCRRTRPRCGRPSCTPRVSYPVTAASGTPVMHAWEGCPEAGGATGYGSIADMEAGGYAMCPACQFGAESMGKVAAASTSIENGFEYHYAAVAQAARDYQEARSRLDPQANAVKEKAGSLLDLCKEALSQVGGQRIKASPPGLPWRGGNGGEPAGGGLLHGVRKLVRAGRGSSRRAGPPSRRQRSCPTRQKKGAPCSPRCWTDSPKTAAPPWGRPARSWTAGRRFWGRMPMGKRPSKTGLRRLWTGWPLASASGLGAWAADALGSCVQALGLEPAELDALKPVLVNTGHVGLGRRRRVCRALSGSQGTRACRCRCGRRVLVGCRRAGRRGFRGNGIGFRHGGNSGGRVPRGRHDPARHHRAASGGECGRRRFPGRFGRRRCAACRRGLRG